LREYRSKIIIIHLKKKDINIKVDAKDDEEKEGLINEFFLI